jgi:uncharacterized LabA/DUF88 family protein
MNQNYFFIDGSALLAQIRSLWKKEKDFNVRRLDPLEFISLLSGSFRDLESESYKRAVFYFPLGEQDLATHLVMPNFLTPGLARDLNFKYCGEKLPKSIAYNNWIETVPPEWQDRCTKSEKGVDVEICCDALRLASLGKIDRLFLVTNDRDFIPLCKTLKDFGVNVSLIHLSGATNPNQALINECDSYDSLNMHQLENIFEKPVVTQETPSSTTKATPQILPS